MNSKPTTTTGRHHEENAPIRGARSVIGLLAQHPQVHSLAAASPHAGTGLPQ